MPSLGECKKVQCVEVCEDFLTNMYRQGEIPILHIFSINLAAKVIFQKFQKFQLRIANALIVSLKSVLVVVQCIYALLK